MVIRAAVARNSERVSRRIEVSPIGRVKMQPIAFAPGYGPPAHARHPPRRSDRDGGVGRRLRRQHGRGVRIVEIGANACVDRAALGVTSIGEGTKLDNMVHVGHNCKIGKHVVVAAQTGFSGGVVVEDYAIIGGQVGIGDKVRIESRAVLGSGCGVLTSKIVRAGQVMWGTPARITEMFGTSAASIKAEKRHFTFRYRSPMHFLDVFRNYYGPTLKAFAALDETNQRRLADDILKLIASMNRAEDGTMVLQSEYLEIVIVKR